MKNYNAYIIIYQVRLLYIIYYNTIVRITFENMGDVMSFGPELIWGWCKFLSGYTGKKTQKTEAADNWAALSFSGGSVLLLSWDAQACGIAIVSESDKNTLLVASAQTPPIVAALKKHLVGAELIVVEQLSRDRILKLTFRRAVGAGFSATRHLILEAMERYSNLILIDDDGVTIEAAKHIHPAENRFRTVLPGFPYAQPPRFNGVDLESWLSSPCAESIPKISGFGAPLLRALAATDTSLLAKQLAQFYGENSSGQFLTQKIGKYTTIFPIFVNNALPLPGDVRAAGYDTTLSPLLSRDSSARRKGIENHISREISRREKQRGDIEGLLAQNPQEIRAEAELLMSNLWQLKPGAKACELTYWDEDGEAKVATVQLNPALSPQKNAALLFAKYKKLSAARTRAAKLLERVQRELDDLREQLAMVSLTKDSGTLSLIEKELGIAKGKPKNAKGRLKVEADFPPHRRFDLGFALVFAGLSANGNRYVTFNLAASDDVWFHAQGVPGSHVILRAEGMLTDEQEELAAKFCGSLAIWFSKARESNRGRIDYTRRKYVSAIKGSVAGVTYREFSSISADPLFWQEYLLKKS